VPIVGHVDQRAHGDLDGAGRSDLELEQLDDQPRGSLRRVLDVPHRLGFGSFLISLIYALLCVAAVRMFLEEGPRRGAIPALFGFLISAGGLPLSSSVACADGHRSAGRNLALWDRGHHHLAGLQHGATPGAVDAAGDHALQHRLPRPAVAVAPRFVVVTGGGSGIGAATVAQLRRAEYEVLATGRRSESLKGVAAATGCETFVGDVARVVDMNVFVRGWSARQCRWSTRERGRRQLLRHGREATIEEWNQTIASTSPAL